MLKFSEYYEFNVAALTNKNLGVEINVDSRFDHLNRWNFVGMQAFEARQCLVLARGVSSSDSGDLEALMLFQSLFKNFILSYAKCFASSGPGKMKLDPAKVYLQSVDSLAVHERIMYLRHKFAAHADTSDLDEAVISVRETEECYQISNLYTIAMPMDEMEDFGQALEVLENYVVVGVNKALDSLEGKLGKKIVFKSFID